jgi:hypothetical protein
MTTDDKQIATWAEMIHGIMCREVNPRLHLPLLMDLAERVDGDRETWGVEIGLLDPQSDAQK